ncbi:MAG: glutathione S-transferase family protein, partial [Rhodobacterales bacterium]|nr:glutathione S-transferase family protein [Rhodobacterales bacterium]
MGLLVEGKWVDQWYDTQKTGGTFQRKAPSFRHHLGAEGPYRAASGRYHLYVAGACPWAHRTMIFRALKGLESHISVTPVDPLMVENGWEFADTEPLHDAAFLHQIYTRARSDYTGRVTVPVLWDKQTHQIVNNESSEIIRMFNGEFESLSSNDLDFWPADLRESIEVVNERVYSGINNGVYKAGFATSQEAYDKAVVALFDTLDWVERLLSKQPYLVGDTLTEADWRLFTTLLRFDLVYVTHFKCDRKRIVDYPNLWAY